jgi:hypothetical protein
VLGGRTPPRYCWKESSGGGKKKEAEVSTKFCFFSFFTVTRHFAQQAPKGVFFAKFSLAV